MADKTYDEGDEVAISIRHTAWVLDDRGDTIEVQVDGEKGRRFLQRHQINPPRPHELVAEIDRLREERDVLRKVVGAADALRQADPRPTLWHTLDDYDSARGDLDAWDLQEERRLAEAQAVSHG